MSIISRLADRLLSTLPDVELSSSLQSTLPTHDEALAWAGIYPLTLGKALAVPGVFRANVLLQDVGSQIECYEEQKIADDAGNVRWERIDSRRPIVRRPDPNAPREQTVRDFIGNLAGLGEVFLRVDGRDPKTDLPTIAYPIPTSEVSISWDRSGLRRIYRWRGQELKAWRDIVHVGHLFVPDKTHAIGPIQAYAESLTGSGALETWTRSFFTNGALQSVTIQVPGELTSTEADEIRAQWISNHGSVFEPAVLYGGAEAKQTSVDPDKAQALEARHWGVAQVAAMYGLNPYLLAVAMSGANITYQRLPDLFAEAVRLTIYPTYLRKYEMAISELLPRNRRVRFDLSEFLKLDEKTRMETAEIGIRSGVWTEEEWRRREGLPPKRDQARIL